MSLEEQIERYANRLDEAQHTIARLQEHREMLESVVFWMEELLGIAREVQRDLMRFYAPEKGWPPHIEALIAPTDFDTVLADAKKMLGTNVANSTRRAER